MSSLFSSVTNYVRERRRGLAVVAGVAGGVYLIHQYATSKIQEIQDRLVQTQTAREK
jgi:peroxin-3